VIVYKLKGNGYDPPNDKRVGSDVSEVHGDHGVWSTGNGGFKHGAFYAYAPRFRAASRASASRFSSSSGLQLT
jgi:hypothetical protein